MGNTERDKEYLGVDTNVLVAFLDKEHPDNSKTKLLAKHRYNAVNPTIIHEAYHTLVYKQKWRREDAKNTLSDYIDLDTILFLDQTKQITKLGLVLGAKYGLGGRDSLILANFLLNSIERMITFDGDLLNLKELLVAGKRIGIKLPMDLY
ncbi:MAG: PIN domain-containing protein [Methanophagales archaeon]|nr:PIN domain-containing protein [Methanophagales archaeon]MCW3142080.1 PIN domain-containing protein [Methanophagales archaeon]